MAERGAEAAEAKPEEPASAALAAGSAANWRQTFWGMVPIQFVTAMANSVLTPIMPLFLPELGVESQSEVAIWAGVLGGSTSFVAAFTSPIWGRLSDRHGRKVMLIRSSVAIGIFTGLMGVAANVWQMFAFRGLMGIFAGFSAAAIALVASQVPEDRLGYALGWLSTGQLVGSLVGPVIGGLLADLTGSYRIPFFCTSVTLFLATAAVWFIVQEQFTKPQRSGGRGSTLSSLIALARSPILLALFFVFLVGEFGVPTGQPIITLYVQQMVGNLPNLATLAGIAFSISGVANMIAAPFLGTRSDRLGY